MNCKSPSESYVEMTELVLPSDTNFINNLLAGKLMHWIDVAGTMCAYRHSNTGVTTIAVDNLVFHHPIHVGNIVTLKAKVVWVGNTSMEVKIEVYGEDYIDNSKKLCNVARYIFVALDDKGNPIRVPRLKLQTQEEKEEFEKGNKRKEERLKSQIHNS